MAEEKTGNAENKMGIQGDTQSELPRFSTKEEQRPADTVDTKSALEALQKDKPDIADRQDLENLVDVDKTPSKLIHRHKNFELIKTVDPEWVAPEVTAIEGLKKIPTPFAWSVLENDPLQKTYTFSSKAGLETYTIKGIQDEIIKLFEDGVSQDEIPEDLLAMAKGILKYIHTAPEDPNIKKLGTNQKTSGASPEDPRVEQKWWKLFSTDKCDKWSAKGRLGQDENYLSYQDEKLKRQNRQRRVIIADSDPEDQTGQRLVLTKTAWDILRRAPSPVPGCADSFGITDASGFASQSCEKPVQDKKGRWKVEAKTLSADSQTLGQMQRSIRNYVEKQVADGRMEADILATVDGILKYKHGTLEPARYDGQYLVYRIKGKEKPVVIERPPTLIDKIRKETSSQEDITQVEVTPDELKRYLTSKELPAGAQIKNLQLEFSESNARLNGVIDVPIPFVGGKINFDLKLANNPGGDEIVVKDYAVDTKSGQLRKRLDRLEHYLRNINGVITDDVNEQLSDVEVQSITITDKGTLSFGLKRRSPVTN